MNDKPTIGVIAIENNKLAIFGSRMGFMGPVIQDYEPFESELLAIQEARKKIEGMGLPIEETISRPFIRKMVKSYR